MNATLSNLLLVTTLASSLAGCGDPGPITTADSGSARTPRERCDTICARTERACGTAGCSMACVALETAGATCAAEAEGWLACLEAVDDGALCGATAGGGGCGEETMARGVCARPSMGFTCAPFGTCPTTAESIETCSDGTVNEYRVGARVFRCGSDCAAAQNELTSYCTPDAG